MGLSEDGPGQHNPDPSEGPWGGGRPTLHGGASSSRRPGSVRDNRSDPAVHEGRRQTGRQQAYAGSRLKPLTSGTAPPDRPAFQPYWGKPAVRNERGDRGNVGIIRSPVRASILPDSGYDAGKKINGKKRHVLVDTQGLLLCAIVHAANIQDRDGGVMLMSALFGLYRFLLKLYADSGYQGPKFQQGLKRVRDQA